MSRPARRRVADDPRTPSRAGNTIDYSADRARASGNDRALGLLIVVLTIATPVVYAQLGDNFLIGQALTTNERRTFSR